MSPPQIFLLVAAVGLLPIALSYGLDPEAVLGYLFGMTVDGTNGTHVFRAVMGLYLALIIYWILGARSAPFTRPALYSLIVFMFGLAAGRVLSFMLDGVPHWILSVYLVLEVLFGVAGAVMVRKLNRLEASS